VTLSSILVESVEETVPLVIAAIVLDLQGTGRPTTVSLEAKTTVTMDPPNVFVENGLDNMLDARKKPAKSDGSMYCGLPPKEMHGTSSLDSTLQPS
jgi:hypothetical protein